MNSSDHRSLPPELVALIHHVELSESGWYDQLIDQLLLSLLFLNDSPSDLDDLKAGLHSNFDFSADDNTLRKSITRLKSANKLAEANDQSFRITDLAMRDIRTALNDNDTLDQKVSQRFKALVTEDITEVDPDECWESFCSDCLDPLVAKLGARTYELIAAPKTHTSDVYSIGSCADKFPENIREKLYTLFDKFLDTENQDVRNFVLNRLHCYLLTLTVSLPEESLSRLVKKSKSNLQLKLFLDTNFMFSILDLHENPANPVARDLTKLLITIKNHVHSKLYVFPPTIDEANRTIMAVHRELDRIEVSPRLGRITKATMSGSSSGIMGRYLRAAATSSSTLSANKFLEPYLNDLISVLRGVRVEIFNENTESTLGSQEVLDDIHDVQDSQIQYPKDRQKGFEAIRHDVALWHFVSQKRHVRVDSPLDAVYWVVTVDQRLIRFDKNKVDSRDEVSVPVCVHPATLIQMLRLWTPRTALFDSAMLHCVRSLLPRTNETDTEVVTLKILSSLARFEGVDQLPEATVSSVLLNRAVRAGMDRVLDPIEQNQLVRDALLDELRSAKREIDDVRNREAEADAKLQQALSRTQELFQLQESKKKAVERLESDLQNERNWSKKLASDFQKVKERHDRQKMEYNRLRQRIARIIFPVLVLISAPVLVLSFAFGTELMGDLFGVQGHRSTIIGALLGCSCWAVLTKCVGERISWIRDWKIFQWFLSKKKAVLAILGAIAVAIVSKLVWEYW